VVEVDIAVEVGVEIEAGVLQGREQGLGLDETEERRRVRGRAGRAWIALARRLR
jgi:hypothetical protein